MSLLRKILKTLSSIIIQLIKLPLNFIRYLWSKNKILLFYIVSILFLMFIKENNFLSPLHNYKAHLFFSLIMLFPLIVSYKDITFSFILDFTYGLFFLFIVLTSITTYPIDKFNILSFVFIEFYIAISLGLIIKAYKLNTIYLKDSKTNTKFAIVNSFIAIILSISNFIYKVRYIFIVVYYIILVSYTIMIYGFIYAGYNEYAINHDKMEGLFYSEINDDAKETYSKIMYYKNEIINVSNLKGSEPNNVIKLEIALLEETINELNLQYKNYLTDISDSNYFSTITYFTIGYGNIVPKGGYLKKIVQSEIYISHLFTVLIIPILLSFIQNQLTNNSEHRKEQEQNRQLETSQ